MNTMEDLLTKLYSNDQGATSMEKTAEDRMLDGLRRSNQVGENPYSTMSTDELIKLAQQLETETKAPETKEEPASEDEEMAKVAFDMLGGQIMAHATLHELGLIKSACEQGLCRVCKENPMDVEGQSICSKCASAE